MSSEQPSAASLSWSEQRCKHGWTLCTACGFPPIPIKQPSEARPIAIDLDPIEHPAHYTRHPSGVECITITRHLNFNLGNVIKYVWRAGDKGSAIEDLKKARWYLDDEIKRLGGRK